MRTCSNRRGTRSSPQRSGGNPPLSARNNDLRAQHEGFFIPVIWPNSFELNSGIKKQRTTLGGLKSFFLARYHPWDHVCGAAKNVNPE